MVQWLGVQAFTTGGSGSITGPGTNIPKASQCRFKKQTKQTTTKKPHIFVPLFPHCYLVLGQFTPAHAGSVAQLRPTLCNPMDCRAHQAPLFMGFSRQGYWRGWPCPPPGALPDPGIEPACPLSRRILYH